jgi:hypothetical protein
MPPREVSKLRELTAIKIVIPSVLAILLATFGTAGATVIDFETLADSTAITTQFPGSTFSNATVVTAGVSLNEFEFPPNSGTNVAFDDGGVITIAFDILQASVAGRFTYLVPVTLTAFDAALNPIATDVSDFSTNLALSGEPGSSPNELLQVVSALGIARVTIAGDPLGGSFTLDDLAFIERPVVSQAPAPATGALLGAGLIVCGAFRAARWIRRLRARQE